MRLGPEFGMRGAATLLMLSWVILSPGAQAAPDTSAAVQNFYAAIFKIPHPNVDGPRLLELGNQACAVRRGGGSSDDAAVSLLRSLDASGVTSSNADVGTLVHVAVSTLCPEVGYP